MINVSLSSIIFFYKFRLNILIREISPRLLQKIGLVRISVLWIRIILIWIRIRNFFSDFFF